MAVGPKNTAVSRSQAQTSQALTSKPGTNKIVRSISTVYLLLLAGKVGFVYAESYTLQGRQESLWTLVRDVTTITIGCEMGQVAGSVSPHYGKSKAGE